MVTGAAEAYYRQSIVKKKEFASANPFKVFLEKIISTCQVQREVFYYPRDFQFLHKPP